MRGLMEFQGAEAGRGGGQDARRRGR